MALNLDRGSNDLEEIIDKQKKIIDYLKKQTRKCDNKFTTFAKYRSEEIMALYAEVKRLKNENEDMRLSKIKLQFEIDRLKEGGK
jgi:predicted RNase H-like nuclease (RuvC/YqgF family)